MSLTFTLQALLVRHESYIAEAGKERRQMASIIDQLERDKRELELANEKTIEENRELLDQLEHMNHTISTSDAYIQSLATTLRSNRQEIGRLAVLAARSTELEAQLLAIETEQISLQDQFASTKCDYQSAVYRWKNAERTISNLQEQVDKMEKEAIDERERHEEVVTQFERRRAVECELDDAAGRSTGSRLATRPGEEKGDNVVSHFVRDILQDNANLQMGIVELREMLMSSNEEVENLREQMLLHQPATLINESQTVLKNELARSRAPEAVPEVHVHHHYHPQTKAKAATVSATRRPRNRRRTSRTFSQPSGLRMPISPTHPITTRSSTPSSADAILSQTSVTIPPPHIRPNRWSVQSSQNSSSIAPSSVPSSPRSAFRNSSIFDSIDSAIDSSRPTSPESIGADSPLFLTRHNKSSSYASLASFSARKPSDTLSGAYPVLSCAPEAIKEDLIPDYIDNAIEHCTIPEEPEEDLLPEKPTLTLNASNAGLNDIFAPSVLVNPRLHRANSHESILSIQCPTKANFPRSKPSELLAHNTPSRTSNKLSTPIIDPTFAIAQPIPSHPLRVSSRNYNRFLLSGRSPFVNDSTDIHSRRSQRDTSAPSHLHHNLRSSSSSSSLSERRGKPPPPPLTKLVGNWMTGKWGISPKASSGDSRVKTTERTPGVNQPGIIKGLVAPRTPYNVEAKKVDVNALHDSLGDG